MTLYQRAVVKCDMGADLLQTQSLQKPAELTRVDGMDIYPLNAVGRKLMFGAHKGVSEEVLKYFIENLENSL